LTGRSLNILGFWLLFAPVHKREKSNILDNSNLIKDTK